MYYQPASLILTQANSMGYKPKFFGVDGMDGILTMEGFDPKLAEGVMLLTPFNADATDDKTASFVKKYKEQFGETPNQFAADAYDCVYAYKQALENAGATPDMSAEDLCDKMIEQFTSMTFDGLTGEGMTWDETGAVYRSPRRHGYRERRFTLVCKNRLRGTLTPTYQKSSVETFLDNPLTFARQRCRATMARAAVSRTAKLARGHIKNARASEGGLEAVLLYRYL